MKQWTRSIQHLTRDAIMSAIKCDQWQKLRLSMKGIPTTDKLDRCETWLVIGCETCGDKVRSVQIDNYINALKRGGQLDGSGYVVR